MEEIGMDIEVSQNGKVEVLTELELCAMHANYHYRNAGGFAKRTLEEAIESGRYLAKARTQVKYGEWGHWLDVNFEGSRRTANDFTRLFNHKEELGISGDREFASITDALLMLRSPKDEPEKDEEPDLTLEDEITSYDEDIGEEEIDETEEVYTKEEVEDQRKTYEEKLKRLQADKKRLQQEQQEREALVERQYTEAIAALQAKYGADEQPGFLGISGEAWAQAFDEAKSHRVQEVAKHLHEIYTWPKWMGDYSPEEAVDAVLGMDHAQELTEALTYVSRWLQNVLDGVEERAERSIK